MPIDKLNPYLHFNGNALEAIAFYERVLGARREDVLFYSQAPGGEAFKDSTRVMHACLLLGETRLMLSDMPPGMEAKAGSNVEVYARFEDAAEMGRAFDGLATGGTSVQPPHDTFFGARLGMLVDPFGVRWILMYEPKKS